MISRLNECTYRKIKGNNLNIADDYLGGKGHIEELQDLVTGLKNSSSMYTIFKDVSAQEDLGESSDTLNSIIISEEKEYIKTVKSLSIEENETITKRSALLKDILWTLKEEILSNLRKIEYLFTPKNINMTLSIYRQLKNFNALFNNLDRLEVRGRDSAGISIINVVEEKDYHLFKEELDRKLLLKEFLNRQKKNTLLNRSITINKGNDKISVIFTYKIAAQIGHLGDNVKFLRKQLHDDKIFQFFITCPSFRQTIFAHTRWASVGEISESNCHPVDNLVPPEGQESGNNKGIIHVCLNGDIDNYLDLKKELEREIKEPILDHITSDTKIIPYQIQKYYDKGHSVEDAFRMAVNDFKGSHAIAMHTDLAPGKLFLAQRGSGQTLFIGLGDENYIAASEIYGLVEETSLYIKIEGEKGSDNLNGENSGQIFILNQDSFGGLDGITTLQYDGTSIKLAQNDIKQTEIRPRDIDRQEYPHFFFKEISESSESVEKTIQNKWQIINKNGKRHPLIILDDKAISPELTDAIKKGKIKNILFMGQGTAGIAACACAEILAYYLNETGINVTHLKASEFSGRLLNTDLKDTLIIAISQSGTTTDTNTAIDMAKKHNAYTISIVNRRDSDITFKTDGVLYTSTGRDIEMSVASTKAYYSQIAAGSMLGLKITQLMENKGDSFIRSEIERLIIIPSLMKKVLAVKKEIKKSAYTFAPTKKYWAVVGSGYNKIAADEIRIKLSELCYKTISSDVVEDKKHIDLSSEPLIVVCAAGSRGNVINDIIKDTAIFKAHKATTIVIASEGEERFRPYADSLIFVPEIDERFSPVLTTMAGHLWGYYAARAINDESRFLSDFRMDISTYVSKTLDKGLDIYQAILEKTFQENISRFFSSFKERLSEGRYTTAMGLNVASDLTLLLKYLSGRLPTSDFELDFGISGTAPNMYEAFLSSIGKAINDMARPIDAIKHQAKTVTVGTSRIWEPIEGLLFETLKEKGFDEGNITNKNVIVLRNLQTIVEQIKGETLYQIGDLAYTGEPVEDSKIAVLKKKGSSEGLMSRVEGDNKLKGTKKIIVKAGNVFIGKGKIDNRSILAIPIMKQGPTIDHLLLLDICFKEKIKLKEKIKALGDKFIHIKNIVEETGVSWQDNYLDLIDIEVLFGKSAEKISESIISSISHN
jgi:glucosamine--fructose-6-phosphate aminotransferase (isomerizing)